MATAISPTTHQCRRLSLEERSQYRLEYSRDGYVVIRNFVSSDYLSELRSQALKELQNRRQPVEYEADLGYPGAPESRSAHGGQTIRRLLHAYTRHQCFKDFVTDPELIRSLRIFSNRNGLVFTPNHHNCLMSKHPGFSSSTYWHQDIRYWHFEKSELVSVWLGLTDENAENGALKVIPGSHRLAPEAYELGNQSFLDPKSKKNQSLIKHAKQIELQAGDALFFHCRLFHGANRNDSSEVKLSLVLTYHSDDNHPIEGSRSTKAPEIPLDNV
ncbi:MAG: phytanoyl-CoA dioxygenase family protein [Gammaproteobacteria bacterium]|nr:phytanoyl-CoA dioxygenase family protein [Gammaproteobacteria bacterium]